MNKHNIVEGCEDMRLNMYELIVIVLAMAFMSKVAACAHSGSSNKKPMTNGSEVKP